MKLSCILKGGSAMKEPKKNVIYRHFKLPAGFPMVALLGDQWRTGDGPITGMHFHNCLEIGYLMEGKGTLFMGDVAVPIAAPALTIVPPNTVHITQAEEGSICRWNWLYMDPIQMLSGAGPQIASELNRYQHTLGGADCVISAQESPEALQLVGQVIDELNHKETYHQDVVRFLLSALFMVLLRIQPKHPSVRYTQSRDIGIVAPAISCISEEYMNDVTVEKLAELCHVSVSHFRRLFKQVIGWSPQEYLQMVRIDHACELLYNCDYSVTEVAVRVGYPSSSSLTRQFNRMYGTSPNRWRKKTRKEENPEVTAYFRMIPGRKSNE